MAGQKATKLRKIDALVAGGATVGERSAAQAARERVIGAVKPRKKNPKKNIADRTLKALPPAKRGERYEVWDTRLPGFGVRVGDDVDKARPGKAGRIAFILYTRFPGHAHPARRTLGQYGAITLEQARAKAGDWLAMIRKGIDPAVAEEKARQAALLQAVQVQERSFAAVAEDFIAQKLPGERKGKEVARDIRNVFLPVWSARPIDEISDLDVLAIINKKKRTAPAQARNLLGTLKRLFSWAIDQRVYGLNASPCDRLKPTAIIGEKIPRPRRLDDDEFFAFLRAVRRLPYPYGPVYQLLALTGCRLREIADAQWSEIRDGVLTIPAKRMKGKNSKARDHAVPLPAAALAIIEQLPRFHHAGGKGKYMFSASAGAKPIQMAAPIKRTLDARMLRTLKALARKRGDDPDAVELGHWVNHDLRRNVRSGLSALKPPIDQRVCEAILAHKPQGIVGVYDVHTFFDEKREVLEKWAAHLQNIVEPPPDNVVKLAGRA
ncbi:MAG TPA: integrase family protein [Pseudolabrys sp.]